MKCTRFRCTKEAELTVDDIPWCKTDVNGYLGLQALINTENDPALNSDFCDNCGAPLLGDFIAQDVKGRLFCSVACAYARNGVKRLEDNNDNNT